MQIQDGFLSENSKMKMGLGRGTKACLHAESSLDPHRTAHPLKGFSIVSVHYNYMKLHANDKISFCCTQEIISENNARGFGFLNSSYVRRKGRVW